MASPVRAPLSTARISIPLETAHFCVKVIRLKMSCGDLNWTEGRSPVWRCAWLLAMASPNPLPNCGCDGTAQAFPQLLDARQVVQVEDAPQLANVER
jgi:hypothetical protein